MTSVVRPFLFFVKYEFFFLKEVEKEDFWRVGKNLSHLDHRYDVNPLKHWVSGCRVLVKCGFTSVLGRFKRGLK